jgi:hypothetical protein
MMPLILATAASERVRVGTLNGEVFGELRTIVVKGLGAAHAKWMLVWSGRI